MRSVVSVRPSVSTPLLDQLTADVDFCPCVGHGRSSTMIDSQGRRSGSKVNREMCAIHEYLGVL